MCVKTGNATVLEWANTIPPAAEIRRELKQNSQTANLLREMLTLAEKRDKLQQGVPA
jgi:uncharacterized protein (UPF0276 family)